MIPDSQDDDGQTKQITIITALSELSLFQFYVAICNTNFGVLTSKIYISCNIASVCISSISITNSFYIRLEYLYIQYIHYKYILYET